jgi:hypothetical protein
MQEDTGVGNLPFPKQLVVLATAILTLVGVFDALENIPVVSGCAFYAECTNEDYRTPPGAMRPDPVS